MKRFERMLLVCVLALSTAAFAQHGGGHGGGMGAGSSMGADHGMSGSHDVGPSNGPAANSNSGHGSNSMSSASPDKVLSHNTAIASKIKDLTGQDAGAACSGFKNLGQCVAAAHVSKNLGISFADLKAKMTGSSPESLGKAIKDLKPAANSKAETKKGQSQAEQDMKDSSS